MNSINLKENRAELVETMEAILDTAKSEDRDLTEEESNSWEGFDTEIKALDKKIAIAERQEQLNKSIAVNMSVQTDQEAANKEMKSWSLFKAVKDIQKGGLTGVEAEMHKEAEAEGRTSLQGIGIPSWMANKAEGRTAITQTGSAVQPTTVNAFADGLIEDSLYNRVGITNLGTLAADTVVPFTGANVPLWEGESDSATDVGKQFTKITLSPNRIAGYVDLSNQIMIQNGTGAEAAIMRDLGKQIAKKIDGNMFAYTSAADGPASVINGATAVTVESTYVAGESVGKDMLAAIQTLADSHGLAGNLGFVNDWHGYSDIKNNALVGSVSPLYNDDRLAGYPGWFNSALGHTGGGTPTSFYGCFGDFSRIYFAQFGPTNILVDPYSASGAGAVRLMVNQYYDWNVASAASFVKYDSLLA